MPLTSVLRNELHADNWVYLVKQISAVSSTEDQELRKEHRRLAQELMKVDIPTVLAFGQSVDMYVSASTNIVGGVDKVFSIPGSTEIMGAWCFSSTSKDISDSFEWETTTNTLTVRSNVSVNDIVFKILYVK
jgi:hypothetical protein